MSDPRLNDDDAPDRVGLNIKLLVLWLVCVAVFGGAVAGIVWLAGKNAGAAIAVVGVAMFALAGVRTGGERR